MFVRVGGADNHHLIVLDVGVGDRNGLLELGSDGRLFRKHDVLALQLQQLGIPVDLHKLGLHPQLGAHGSGKLGLKAGQLAVLPQVVHGLEQGIADL